MDRNLQMAVARDPVCWMDVDPNTSAYRAEQDGVTYYFCSRGCMLDFQEEPEKYLTPDYKPQGAHDMGGH